MRRWSLCGRVEGESWGELGMAEKLLLVRIYIR